MHRGSNRIFKDFVVQGQGLMVREQGQGVKIEGQGEGQGLVNRSSRIIEYKNFPRGQH